MFDGYLEKETKKQAKDNYIEKCISTWYPYNFSLVRGSKPLGEKLWCVYFQGIEAPETHSRAMGRENSQDIGVGIYLKERKADSILQNLKDKNKVKHEKSSWEQRRALEAWQGGWGHLCKVPGTLGDILLPF